MLEFLSIMFPSIYFKRFFYKEGNNPSLTGDIVAKPGDSGKVVTYSGNTVFIRVNGHTIILPRKLAGLTIQTHPFVTPPPSYTIE